MQVSVTVVYILPIHDKYDCPIAYVSYTTNISNGYIDPTFFPYVLNTTNYNIYFSCFCKMCARNHYAHQITHKCLTFDRLIWKMYIQICATYEVTTNNHVTVSTVHIFDILMNKYACRIAHLYPSVLLL